MDSRSIVTGGRRTEDFKQPAQRAPGAPWRARAWFVRVSTDACPVAGSAPRRPRRDDTFAATPGFTRVQGLQSHTWALHLCKDRHARYHSSCGRRPALPTFLASSSSVTGPRAARLSLRNSPRSPLNFIEAIVVAGRLPPLHKEDFKYPHFLRCPMYELFYTNASILSSCTVHQESSNSGIGKITSQWWSFAPLDVRSPLFWRSLSLPCSSFVRTTATMRNGCVGSTRDVLSGGTRGEFEETSSGLESAFVSCPYRGRPHPVRMASIAASSLQNACAPRAVCEPCPSLGVTDGRRLGALPATLATR